MRTIIAFVALLLVAASLPAQQDERSYFGVKAGANFSNVRLDPEDPFTDFSTATGFAGGAFYHIAMGKSFALQPELLFSEMGGKFEQVTEEATYEGDLNLNYFSLPLLLKISPIEPLGILLGPQMDMFINGKFSYDDPTLGDTKINNSNTKSDLDFALTGGLQFRLAKNLNIYGRYIYGLSDVADGPIGEALQVDDEIQDISNDAIQVGLSLGFPYKPKMEEQEVQAMAPPPDTDGDGTPDATDLCPLVAGSAKYNGCPPPDTDGDGINDEIDKCPSIAGTAKYGGCPVPDSDADGIADDVDNCPYAAGLAAYNGCPVPDTDGDGIKDDTDRCPTTKGTAAYNGCPVPDSDEDGLNDEEDICPHYKGDRANFGCPDMTIWFDHNDPELTVDDKMRLDKALEVIQDSKRGTIKLEGHASPPGDAEYNKKLSLQRAESVKAYFVSKGVDAARISTVGLGEEFPMQSDNKDDVNLLSRRVVIKTMQ